MWIPAWKRVDGLVFEGAGVGNADIFRFPDCYGVAFLAQGLNGGEFLGCHGLVPFRFATGILAYKKPPSLSGATVLE